MNETRSQWMNDYDRLLFDLKTRTPTIYWLELIIWIFFIVMAVIGNGLTLKIIFVNPQLRTSSNFLIASLAISDFLLQSLTSTLCVGVMATSRWPYNSITCQYHGILALTLACASVLNLTLMALNRYFRVVKPKDYQRYFSPRQTAFYVGLVWTASLVGSVSYVMTGHRYVFNPGKYFCYLNMDDDLFLAMVVTFYTALPSLTIAFCYLQVHRVIRNHNKSMSSNSSLTAQEINITKTLFIIVVMFNICWLPIFVIDIIDVLKQSWSMPRQIYALYSFCAASSASINPALYGIMNPIFRKEYLKVLGYKKHMLPRKRKVEPIVVESIA